MSRDGKDGPHYPRVKTEQGILQFQIALRMMFVSVIYRPSYLYVQRVAPSITSRAYAWKVETPCASSGSSALFIPNKLCIKFQKNFSWWHQLLTREFKNTFDESKWDRTVLSFLHRTTEKRYYVEKITIIQVISIVNLANWIWLKCWKIVSK